MDSSQSFQFYTMLLGISAAIFMSNFSNTVNGQSMDPKVTITETDPPSDGHRVRGTIAKDVLLTCYVENLPADLQVRWRRTIYDKDGRATITLISTDMAVEDTNKWSIEKPTQFSWRLRIKAIAIQDEANYTCFVRLTSNNNVAEANRTVFATSPPTILDGQSSSNIFAKEGDFVPLRCNASGRPTPTVMWRREGNAILPGGGVTKLGSNLDIRSLDFMDRGRYYCEALNEVGYDRREISLTVQHSAKITPDPPTTRQAIGYQRTLVCHIDAFPMPSLDWDTNQLMWIKNSKTITPSDGYEIRGIVGAYNRITYELIIKRVQEGDLGTYTCQATTNLGKGRGNVVLERSDVPLPDKRGQTSGGSHAQFSLLNLLFCVTFLCIKLFH